MSATQRNGTTCVTFAVLLTMATIAGLPVACDSGEPAMKITSPAFADGSSIPRQYTCDGEDVPPPLSFEGVPPGAVSLALIVDDPDAPRGAWVHWVVWNIAPGAKSPEGVTGKNSWGKNAWGGPCPPGGEHRYVFRLVALDQSLQLPSSGGRKELEAAMKGHVVAEAKLVGRYRR